MIRRHSPNDSMKLSQTTGYSYMSFKPPLSDAELNELPYPKLFGVERRHVDRSCELDDDGTMEIGFNSDLFAVDDYSEEVAESFPRYADRVAKYLGHYTLDPNINEIDLESFISYTEVEI